MRLPPDFNDVLLAFEKEVVEYVIIGGYAVALRDRP
jgi:hypothetical protein